MEIRFELNQRHGRGFQLRLVHGPMDKLYDEEPLNMYQAGAYATTLLEMANKELGTDYKPQQVFRVPGEALEANAGTDFAAAWIRRTYARHVQDDESLMQYVIVQG